MDVLDHHDRVIDDEADRQHHGEQRQQVDRIAERQQPPQTPISDSGMVTTGISTERNEPRNSRITTTTITALADGAEHFADRGADRLVGS